jgi:hypothetical protein
MILVVLIKKKISMQAHTVIMKKMEIPDIVKELKSIYQKIDTRATKYGKISDEEINDIVKKYRKK